jgi:hypothetical protein
MTRQQAVASLEVVAGIAGLETPSRESSSAAPDVHQDVAHAPL